ncbi:hypothetical protein AB0M34_32165 [Nocardia sp. NPDC050193]
MLLGSPAAVAAGRAWFEDLVQLGHIAQGLEVSHTELADLVVSIGTHRDAFYAAARDDLGVTSGVLPSSAFTREPPRMITGTDGVGDMRPAAQAAHTNYAAAIDANVAMWRS